LVEDGATLQMGIGGIPDAVLGRLGNKVDLGVHTEMFSDGLIPLLEGGVVTNRHKEIHRYRTVTSFVAGTRRVFDHVDGNPLVEFHPCDRTNDTALIAMNPRVTAINSAIEVDLSGQVCADSMGAQIYSGIGGQMDFIRGAARSRGGKPIIALPSTAAPPWGGGGYDAGSCAVGCDGVRSGEPFWEGVTGARRVVDRDCSSGFSSGTAEANDERPPFYVRKGVRASLGWGDTSVSNPRSRVSETDWDLDNCGGGRGSGVRLQTHQ
jgi:hypothetical protein